LLLVACGLKFIKKFLRALQVRLRQLAMVHREPGQQVVVFNSFHLSKYILYYPSEHVKLEACCLLLEAWALTLALRAVKHVEAGVLYFNSLGDRPTSN